VSAAALPFFEVEAQKRKIEGQKAGGVKAGRGRKASGPIGPKAIEHRARDDAAKAFGTTPRMVQRGKFVLAK